MIRVAKAGCRLSKRIEHRLQVESRAADDLEHVGRGGLLLQRLAQLVKKADVLDGNHRLVGEHCHQLDLFLREWLDDRSCANEHADRDALSQEWNAEITAVTAEGLEVAARVFRIGQNIRNVNGLAFQRG